MKTMIPPHKKNITQKKKIQSNFFNFQEMSRKTNGTFFLP